MVKDYTNIFSNSLDKEPAESLANKETIVKQLVGFSILLYIIFAVAALLLQENVPMFIASVAGILSMAVILQLVKTGQVVAGSIAGLIIAGLVNTITLIMGGTLQTPLTAIFLLLIIISGLLFENRGVLFSSFIFYAIIIMLFYMEIQNLLPSPLLLNTYYCAISWIIVAAAAIFIANIYLKNRKEEKLVSSKKINELNTLVNKYRAQGLEFETLFSSLPTAFSISTVDGSNYIEVNDAFIKLTGYNREDIIGNPDFEKNFWVNLNDRLQVIRKINQFGKATDIELIFRKKNKEKRVARLNVSSLMIEDRRYLLSNITEIPETQSSIEIKPLQEIEYEYKKETTPVLTPEFVPVTPPVPEMIKEEIKPITDELKKEEEPAKIEVPKTEIVSDNFIKTSFLSNLSHELRTPLSGILGFSEVLNEHSENDVRKIGDLINRGGNRILEILDSVVDISNIIDEHIPINYSKFNITALIQSIISSLEKVSERNNVEIFLDSKPKQIEVSLDKKITRFILYSVLYDILKNTYQQNIKIYLKEKEANNIKSVLIMMGYSHSGFDEHNIANIITESEKLNYDYLNNYKGTITGLPIINNLVDSLYGKIFIKRITGVGNIISILLPVLKPVIQEKEKIKSSEEVVKITESDTDKIKAKRILYVEDDDICRHLVSTILENSDYKLDFAYDGNQGIELAKENQYDLILMDMNLGMSLNGIETTAEIRKLQNYKKTPIIAVTALSREEEKAEILSKGCNMFLSKPYRKNDLLKAIKEAIETN